MNTHELRTEILKVLERCRCADDSFSYALHPGGGESLYGLIGSIHILSATGTPIGGRDRCEAAAKRILSYRRSDGSFIGPDGDGHALHMVIGALNLLGEPIPADVAPLAPTDTEALTAWLARHAWNSTHKELCGPVIPLLAGGHVSEEWVRTFVAELGRRLRSGSSLETWCAADAPSWQVISCLYHVLCAFDAGRLPYPEPDRIAQRLLGLRWEDASDDEQRTVCTDGDWAWMLLRLSEQRPQYFGEAMTAIRRVSERRIADWSRNREAILQNSTFHLYCYLWVTAVFQSCVRDHYSGGYLRDTLNDPALFRL